MCRIYFPSPRLLPWIFRHPELPNPGLAFLFTYTMTSDLFGIVQHGSKVYSTLVCRDQGSLSSSFSTDKLTILQEPPSSTRAYITITSPLYTAFLPRQGYFPSPPLTAVWGGLEDRAGDPLSYEVRILENGSPVVANRTDWSSARLLTVSELMLPYHPETHLVEVQARNSAGTYSEVRSTGFPSHQTHQLVQVS